MIRSSGRLLVFLFLALAVFVQAQKNLPDLIEEIRPSVVSVITYDRVGDRLSGGTGFVVGSDKIITNYHVIEGALRIEVRTSDGMTYKIIKAAPTSKDADLAILQTEVTNLPFKSLRITRVSPRIGENIFVLGNPLGLTGTVTDGIVSAFRSLPKLGKLLQITAPISPGSSGSPVVNLKGEVVGLVTMDLEGGQNLNFAIASESLISFWPLSGATVSIKSLPRRGKSKRWRLLDKDTTYDTETLFDAKGVVSVWFKYDNPDGSYTKVFTEINCPNVQIRESQSLSYRNSGGDPQQNRVDSIWKRPVPETVGEVTYQVFCKEKADYQSVVDYSRDIELYRQGRDFQIKQKYDEAIATYGQMISELPDFAGWAFNAIAGIKLEQGMVREAKNAVLEAIKLEPLDADTYSTLGDVYKEEKNISGAIEAYWKSLRLPGENSNTYGAVSGLAEIYKARNDYVELTKLYIFANSKGEAYFEELAGVYEQRKMPTLAKSARLQGIKHYEEKIKNRTGEPFLLDYWSLTGLLDAAGEDNKLQITVIAAMKLFPNDRIMVNRLARNYNKHRDWAKSIQLLNEVLSRMKENLDKQLLLYTLKASYLGLGQKDEAARIEAQILQLLKFQQRP